MSERDRPEQGRITPPDVRPYLDTRHKNLSDNKTAAGGA
jgi:hypothetical protein